MMLFRTTSLLVLALPTLVSAATTITQLGSSGKFRISNENSDNDPNKITVECDYIEEVGSSTHKTPTLANQAFALSGPTSTTYAGIAASQVTFAATLTEQGSNSVTYGDLTVEVYVMEGSGTITNGGESYDVVEGDVKFNILLENWNFDTNTQFVDVALIIKGKNDVVTETGNNQYNVGDVPLFLSGQVTVDGAVVAMESGYPQVQQSGNKYTFIFRFPTFTTSATYDPIFTYGACGFSGCSSASLSSVMGFLRGTLWGGL